VEELGQVSRRIARKRTIVVVIGPPLQAAIYNIKGFKHFYSQKSLSRLKLGGGDRQGALCTRYPLVGHKRIKQKEKVETIVVSLCKVF
jgi:hypothetical protein